MFFFNKKTTASIVFKMMFFLSYHLGQNTQEIASEEELDLQ